MSDLQQPDDRPNPPTWATGGSMTQSREEQYRLDDLVSRIWAVCVDTHFHYDGLPNDEDCGVDAAILAKEACAKIKELIQASQPEQTAAPRLNKREKTCPICNGCGTVPRSL